MSEQWTPELQLDAKAGTCRLTLVGVTYGNGPTLQDAATDLLTRLFDLAVAFRAGRFRIGSELGPVDQRVLEFLWEAGEVIAHGGDLRHRVLGIPVPRKPVD